MTIRVLDREATALCLLPDRHYEVRPGHFRLDVPGVARYSVEDGKSILIEPLADATPEKIRLFLLGSTMGALLYQRGLYPLHGSAVETPWGAMIFVGVQGQGSQPSPLNSTARAIGSSATMSGARWSARPDGLRILPALAQIRLRADAWQRLGTPEGSFRFDVGCQIRCAHGRTILARILSPCEPSMFSRISRASPIMTSRSSSTSAGSGKVRQCLLENLYRPFYLKGQRTEIEVSRMAADHPAQHLHPWSASAPGRRDPTPGFKSDFLNFWPGPSALNRPQECAKKDSCGSFGPDDRLALALRELVSTELDQETVLMSINAGAYYGLEGPARSIWEKLETPLTFAHLKDSLVNEYRVSPVRPAPPMCRNSSPKWKVEGLLRVE